MKKFFQEFKEFIAKGNVVDMAVGVIIGGAFGKIVTSLVNDIIMPLVGLVIGGINISQLKLVLTPAGVDETGAEIAEVALNYGNFMQLILDFLIMAFCVFVVLKIVMGLKNGTGKLLKKKKTEEVVEEVPAPPAETEMDVLKDIRELLKKEANA